MLEDTTAIKAQSLPRIRQWSREKLDILGRYLHAYSVIMRKQKQTWLQSYSYIDAFAGYGEYEDKDLKEYVCGSPLVALGCEPPFDDYWFVESTKSRLEGLRSRVKSEFATRSVNYRHGDANVVLAGEVSHRITLQSRQRGFVFLDPYGLDVHFDTIRSLSKSRAFDIFINFSAMGITRNLLREEAPDAQTLQKIGRVMGDSKWAEEQYVTQCDLFGEDRTSRPALTLKHVTEEYARRIGLLFDYVSRPVLMCNSIGTPIYALFLASHNQTAVRITNQILKSHESAMARLL